MNGKLALLVSLLSIKGCGANESSQGNLEGSWECSEFNVSHSFFSVTGKSKLSFIDDGELNSKFEYKYDFGEGNLLIIKFQSIGTWALDGNTLEDSVQEISILNVESNLTIEDSEVEELVKSSIAFNKPQKSKVEFKSETEFTWKTKNSDETIKCKKLLK